MIILYFFLQTGWEKCGNLVKLDHIVWSPKCAQKQLLMFQNPKSLLARTEQTVNFKNSKTKLSNKRKKIDRKQQKLRRYKKKHEKYQNHQVKYRLASLICTFSKHKSNGSFRVRQKVQNARNINHVEHKKENLTKQNKYNPKGGVSRKTGTESVVPHCSTEICGFHSGQLVDGPHSSSDSAGRLRWERGKNSFYIPSCGEPSIKNFVSNNARLLETNYREQRREHFPKPR